MTQQRKRLAIKPAPVSRHVSDVSAVHLNADAHLASVTATLTLDGLAVLRHASDATEGGRMLDDEHASPDDRHGILAEHGGLLTLGRLAVEQHGLLLDFEASLLHEQGVAGVGGVEQECVFHGVLITCQ